MVTWIIIGILLLAAVTAVISLYIIKRQGSEREKISFIILLAFSTIICILFALDVPLPNPVIAISQVFMPVGVWLSKVLG